MTGFIVNVAKAYLCIAATVLVLFVAALIRELARTVRDRKRAAAAWTSATQPVVAPAVPTLREYDPVRGAERILAELDRARRAGGL